MSKLQELIQKLCPDGVEYKKLGELGKRLKGLPITATQMKAMASSGGEIRIFAGGKTKVDTHLAKIPKANIITDPAVLVQSRGVIDFIYYDKPFTFKNEMWAYTMGNNVSVKFLYYYLKSNVETFRRKATAMGTFPQISIPDTENFLIPIPPLEVQEEIVRILDNFTNLAAELQAELQARQEQYEYYRNKLLTFNELNGVGQSVTWMKMSEIGEICMCKRITKDQTNNIDGVPFYKIGTFGKVADAYISRDLYEDYKSRFSFPRKGEILISASGTIGRTVVYDGRDAYFQDSNIVWVHNDETKVLNKYLYHYYQVIEWEVEGGTIKRLYNNNLAKTKIVVPPISEQEHIVSILDKFETLVNDLTEGLPAEMAAVHEQYEYYRNKLLSLPRTKISA